MNRVKWGQTEFTSLAHSEESFLNKENAKEQFLDLLITSKRHLRLPTLEHRRSDLTETYKHQWHLPGQEPQFTTAAHSQTQGNGKKIFTTLARTKLTSSFFSERVVADWHSCPDNVVTAPSVGTAALIMWSQHPVLAQPP